MNATPDPKAAGSRVECVACWRTKAPRGRSAPADLSLCGPDCPGHSCRPLPGDLWPGETREEFGHPCATAQELEGTGPEWTP